MNLIRALYEHCLIKRRQKGKLWICPGAASFRLPETEFISKDNCLYSIVTMNIKPYGRVITFSLFIKDEYEK